MKIKIAEATPLQLDWLVAQIEGATPQQWEWFVEYNKYRDDDQKSRCYDYSSYWNAGGPIIEREGVSLVRQEHDGYYSAWIWKDSRKNPLSPTAEGYGPTPLIAAMRCYVASKLGDTVDIPEELI